MTKSISLEALAEERKFLREHFAMRDPEIARRLGIAWDTYQSIFRRHPELGVPDPNPNEEHPNA